jgi:hypothetical protein
MDWFSDIFKKTNDAQGQAKDAKEHIALTNADEQGGGKYFQSSGDESIQYRTQKQSLPEVVNQCRGLSAPL